jgi:hypothetical protein
MMNDERCLSIVQLYEHKLQKKFYDTPEFDHIREMLEKMPAFLREGRREKFMRWLGFIQGVLWSRGIYELGTLKSHNKHGEISV